MSRKIKVLIVDDSAVVRQAATAVLASAPDIEVMGAAGDPVIALERMRLQWPDVIVLDVEMPRMDGITFLKKIMAEHPTPVVMCSSLTEQGAETTLQALEAGAVAFLTKPKLGVKSFIEEASGDLIRAVREAASANLFRMRAVAALAARPSPASRPEAVTPAAPTAAMARTTEMVVAIGTSTGGTQALEVLLKRLPRVAPGMVVVQHMPEKFSAAFAARLDSVCAVEVREAQGGERVIPGRVLIAPGGRHMQLKRSGAQYLVEVIDGPPVNRHRPSVDVLLRSVARHAGANALGIIMTGMGDDGARGLLEMKQAGARTLAQDEASCVVYGMPKEAVKLGAVDRSLPLDGIAGEIVRLA